ncbi:hypothetical protein HanIR_Chr17g0892141 [Helianthus annuus]|nr:hypothetical protein HanIR_Chr17g0892141 [Helianthus annuus]
MAICASSRSPAPLSSSSPHRRRRSEPATALVLSSSRSPSPISASIRLGFLKPYVRSSS